jgi:hypothetical protein
MPTNEELLKTEYSVKFDALRKNRMIASFYKYGLLKTNMTQNLTDPIKSLERYLAKYIETGNTEFLCDVANFAMMEFMYPHHTQAHFKATDSNESPGVHGMPINLIKEFDD